MPAVASGASEPLVFDFLADPAESSAGLKVLTGHDSGVITISLAEADDVTREQNRVSMGETYRTLLGHFRHEVGHYYWDKLVRDGGQIDSCRAVFGDESEDYDAALQRHYAEAATGRTASSAHMLPCTLGRISPKLLRTISISSTHWRQPTLSAFGCVLIPFPHQSDLAI